MFYAGYIDFEENLILVRKLKIDLTTFLLIENPKKAEKSNILVSSFPCNFTGPSCRPVNNYFYLLPSRNSVFGLNIMPRDVYIYIFLIRTDIYRSSKYLTRSWGR